MSKQPTPDDALSPSLARLLAEDADTWILRLLWARMPLALRQEAVQAVLEDDDEDAEPLQAALVAALAGAGGFRERTLRRLEPARAAELAGRLSRRRLPSPPDVFRVFLTRARAEMLARYLDELGVAHVDGKVASSPDTPLDAADVARAARAIRGAFPPDDVTVYLAALLQVNPHLATGADAWLRETLLPETKTEEAAEHGTPAAGEEEDGTAEPELIREARSETRDEAAVPADPFTPLDRTLIRIAVDAAQGVEGAPDPLTLEDMVEEVLELNGSRHRSFFHRGFVDALQEREWRTALPAENEARRRWYAAGWLSGTARRGRHDRVVERFDTDPALQEFHARIDEAAYLTLPLLFEALCRAEREPEAVRMVSPDYLTANPLLLPRLLDQGTRLLRAGELERARPLFDRLGEVVARLEAGGERTTEPFFLEIRRRRAHCYRQSGDAERARALLDRLLEEDPDPDVRARVLADLGLLDAGLRTLADVRLWRTGKEKPDVLSGLERGRERFQASLDTESSYAAHGAWPLAVLAMGTGRWEEARDLLSSVRSHFLKQRARYDQKRLLARVTVAAGVAEALTLDLNGLPRARNLLLEGTEGGARIPRLLLRDVLDALDEAGEDLDRQVLTAVLDLEGPDVLDYLRDSKTAGRTPAVALHLMERARNDEIAGEVRVRDLRTALPILLSDRFPDRAEAGQALDLLEELAWKKVGTDEFLEFLARPEELDPVWSWDDAAWARAALLESRRNYEAAVPVLEELLARTLASPGRFGHEDPREILAHARGYGLDGEWTESMTRRVDAWTKENGDEPEPPFPTFQHPNQRLKVLVVGGDERQRGLEAAVQAKLDEEGLPIQVSHLPTGWSGNWAGTLERALAEAERHQALVLIRFMRTQFGRSLRKGIERPWVACPGVGVGQVVRRVRKAAGLVGGGSL